MELKGFVWGKEEVWDDEGVWVGGGNQGVLLVVWLRVGGTTKMVLDVLRLVEGGEVMGLMMVVLLGSVEVNGALNLRAVVMIAVDDTWAQWYCGA